jgi:signal peptidase I
LTDTSASNDGNTLRKHKGFRRCVSQPGDIVVVEADINTISDENLRELLLVISRTNIDKLRNSIVHKQAYRPSLSEAQDVVDDARKAINGISGHFRIWSDDYHINEKVND